MIVNKIININYVLIKIISTAVNSRGGNFYMLYIYIYILTEYI